MDTPPRTEDVGFPETPREAKRRRPLMRYMGGVAIAVAALAAASFAGAAAQDLPPGPTSLRPLTRLYVETAPEGYEEAQMLLLDFPAGRWTPRHSHAGLTLVRVLEGEMTLRRDATEGDLVYGPGEGWVEQPGVIHSAGNAGGEMAKVQVTFLLAKGAPLTVVDGTPSASAPPGPSTAFQSRRVELPAPTAAFDEAATTMLSFEPGAWTPQHSHAGLTLVGVMGGDMSVRIGDQEAGYTQGDLWIEQPGDIHAAGNAHASGANVAVTFLQNRGEPVTTVAGAQVPVQLPR